MEQIRVNRGNRKLEHLKDSGHGFIVLWLLQTEES